MIEDEASDPIKIELSPAMDRRLAQLNFSSDNSPRDPNNATPLRGAVSFGTKYLRSNNSRNYQIKIRSAFLNIVEKNCRFVRNENVDKKIQNSKYEEVKITKEKEKMTSESGVELSTTQLKFKGNLGIGGKLTNNTEIMVDTRQQYDVYIQRWASGGFEIGDPSVGDPRERDGCLKGDFMSGVGWGELVPDRHAQQYGALVQVLIRKGGLSVELEKAPFFDGINLSRSGQNDEAFDLLKSAVASWAVENQLVSGQLVSGQFKDGHNENSNELVLAEGKIHVDLTQLVPLLDSAAYTPQIESKERKALPAPSSDPLKSDTGGKTKTKSLKP